MIRAALLVTLLAFGQWPQFRGPDGNGVSTATGLPVTWSETRERPLEDRDPRPRLVVAGRARPAGLADDGDAGRQGAVRDRDRQGQRARSSSTSSCSTSPRRSSRTRSTPTRRRRRSIEAGPRLRDVRIARHRRDRHRDRQGRCGSGAISSAITSAAPARRRSSSATCC